MKLTIFGKHPVPQGGFNGVMSIFEAIGFGRSGFEVTLAIPFENEQEHALLLEKHRVSSLDEFPKFGAKFKIVPVFPDGTNFDQTDVLVYQSYFPKDHELFWGLCQERGRLLTKNFPKFVTNSESLREGHIVGQFKQFDLIACALREDVALLDGDTTFAREFAGAYAYVPRGASPEMLHPGFKAGLPPTIGMDTPNNNEPESVQHYFEAIERLRRDYPDLRVLSVGREIPGANAEKVPFGRFDGIYERFFNQIHTYLTINYEHSPQHLQARVQQEVASWRRKAIYEVQNIEAQMSGAPLVGHRDNIIAELYIPGKTGFNFQDFDDAEAIYKTIKFTLDNHGELSRASRDFAVRNFSWDRCIELWSKAIRDRFQTLFG